MTFAVKPLVVGATVVALPAMLLGYLSVFGFWNGAAAATMRDYLNTMVSLGMCGALIGATGAAIWRFVHARIEGPR